MTGKNFLKRLLPVLFLIMPLGIAPVFSQPVGGLSALASAGDRFPCKRVIDFYRRAPEVYLGAMWKTFGARRRCWKRVLSLPKRATLQIYISNEVARKKGNASSYELLPQLSIREYNEKLESKDPATIRKVSRTMRRIRRFCDRNLKEGDRCLLALGLESQFTRKALGVLVDLAEQNGFRNEDTIHNPSSVAAYQARGSAGIIERHAGRGAARLFYDEREPAERVIITFDGIDPSFCSRRERTSLDRISPAEVRLVVDYHRNRARYIGAWCGVWQGLTADSRIAPDPRSRRFIVPRRSLKRWAIVFGYR